MCSRRNWECHRNGLDFCPLSSKMSNRISTTNSSSFWFFPVWMILVSFFLFPLPLTFVPCSSEQHTSSNLIYLFLFFVLGTYSSWVTPCLAGHSFFSFRPSLANAYTTVLCQTLLRFPVSCLQNPILPSSLALVSRPWGASFLNCRKVTFHTSIHSTAYPLLKEYKAHGMKSQSLILLWILLRLSHLLSLSSRLPLNKKYKLLSSAAEAAICASLWFDIY